MENEAQQEMMLKFQMFEQQIRGLQQQLQAVEQAIVDLGSLNLGLDDLKGKKDKEIFALIGKGIYAKAKLISEDLIVDIGGKNFVGKSIDETKELMQNQIKKLENVKDELNSEMEKINNELTETFMNAQEHSHECNCGDNCECSENECGCGDEECECGCGKD